MRAPGMHFLSGSWQTSHIPPKQVRVPLQPLSLHACFCPSSHSFLLPDATWTGTDALQFPPAAVTEWLPAGRGSENSCPDVPPHISTPSAESVKFPHVEYALTTAGCPSTRFWDSTIRLISPPACGGDAGWEKKRKAARETKTTMPMHARSVAAWYSRERELPSSSGRLMSMGFLLCIRITGAG